MQRLAQLIAEPSDRRNVDVARGDTAASAAFDRAIGHFEHGHWSQAFEELVPLAEARLRGGVGRGGQRLQPEAADPAASIPAMQIASSSSPVPPLAPDGADHLALRHP